MTRWGEELEVGPEVQWGSVIEELPLNDSDRDSVRRRLQDLGRRLTGVTEIMQSEGVDALIIQRRGAYINAVVKGLCAL